MVLHGLVDVQVRARRRVKAGEQLVHHDQKLHIGGLLDEQGFGLFFISLGFGLAGQGIHVFKQRGVGAVEKLLVCLGVGTGFFLRNVLRLRVVGRDYRAFAFQGRALKQTEVLAGLVNTGGHQNGIAPFARQTWFAAEVKHNVAHHPRHARAGAQHVLHGAPLGFQLVALPVIQALGFGLKPGVYFVGRAQRLVNVPGFVHQV